MLKKVAAIAITIILVLVTYNIFIGDDPKTVESQIERIDTEMTTKLDQIEFK